ncbi:tellurite resistance/C4-dicarboxylate transporter family protein [Mycobacterium canetti]|nr:tellurite resistance/C4-dicarboxylate transporter family protein [Mycobacterium canetti]
MRDTTFGPVVTRLCGWTYALSVVLLWVTCTAYAVLIAVSTTRIVIFRKEFADDLADPRRGFGMFTFVAASDVLGTRLVIDAHRTLALGLLIVGLLGWLVLGYIVPWTTALGHRRRPTLPYANGTWFIWVVASQSVAVLSAVLQTELESGRRELALVAVLCWSVGAFLYVAVGILVVARLLLYPLRPADLTPPYWVAMGRWAPRLSPCWPAPTSSKWLMHQWLSSPADSLRERRWCSGPS